AGILAPAMTPPALITRLNAAEVAALDDPQLRSKLQQAGVTPSPGSAEDFGRYLRAEIARWGKLIREEGIKGEELFHAPFVGTGIAPQGRQRLTSGTIQDWRSRLFQLGVDAPHLSHRPGHDSAGAEHADGKLEQRRNHKGRHGRFSFRYDVLINRSE